MVTKLIHVSIAFNSPVFIGCDDFTVIVGQHLAKYRSVAMCAPLPLQARGHECTDHRIVCRVANPVLRHEGVNLIPDQHINVRLFLDHIPTIRHVHRIEERLRDQKVEFTGTVDGDSPVKLVVWVHERRATILGYIWNGTYPRVDKKLLQIRMNFSRFTVPSQGHKRACFLPPRI